MNQYDVIVIGCNISSLISAISLLNDGYKVLLIDKRNTIGEIINTIVIIASIIELIINTSFTEVIRTCYKIAQKQH